MRVVIPRVTVGKRTRYIPYNVNRLRILHWATRAKWTKAWREQTAWALLQKKKEWQGFTGRINLVITNFTISTMDRDNLYGSAKPIIDALRDVGLIKDDTEEYLNLEVKQEVVEKKERQRVEMEINQTE